MIDKIQHAVDLQENKPQAAMVPCPVLSIFVPTYNRANYMETLLNEICRKDLFPFSFEIVVVNNGSDDQTKDLLQDWSIKSDLIRVYNCETTIAYDKNYERALRLCQGSFAVYIADDDRIDPKILTDVIVEMQNDVSIAAYVTPVSIKPHVHSSGHIIRRKNFRKQRFKRSIILRLLWFIVNNGINPEIIVYRTSIAHRVHLTSQLNYWSFSII